MRDLNIDFLEEYKSVDNICKDIFGTKEGISEYIRRMEITPWNDYKYVSSWQSDYSEIKHARWIRNQITHENGTMDSDICSQDDLDWIIDFRQRILTSFDPFAIIRNAKEEETKKQIQRQQELKRPQQNDIKRENNFTSESESRKEKISLWQRIKNFFTRDNK